MGSFSTSVFEVIDMRSFSNLWYWIALAVMWSTMSHWVLGVPFDMVTRARKHGAAPMADLERLTDINVNRLLYIGREAGLWLVALFAFILSALVMAGFVYKMQFAQAVFLMLFPLSIIWMLSIRTATMIDGGGLRGEDLCRRLTRHRLHIQLLGVMFIFATAMWGMYQNFNAGPLFPAN